VHPNPNVRGPVERLLGNHQRIHLIDPLDYEPFVFLMERSYIIITDSGGVQEEAPSLRKPILVMRETTERPEALDAGAVELVGTSVERIVASLTRLLTEPQEYARRQLDQNPYGDGQSAGRIVDIMLKQGWQK
jgi:UDP-N-acetylglucosamine 2-epimerase